MVQLALSFQKEFNGGVRKDLGAKRAVELRKIARSSLRCLKRECSRMLNVDVSEDGERKFKAI